MIFSLWIPVRNSRQKKLQIIIEEKRYERSRIYDAVFVDDAWRYR